MKRPFEKNKANKSKPSPHRRSSRTASQSENGVFVVDSVSAIKEFLRFKPGAIKSISVQEKSRSHFEKMLAEFLAKTRLSLLAAKADEPMISAKVELSPSDFDEYFSGDVESKAHDIVLALDHIEDPRNLGAIIRSAAFFGVKCVVAPQDRQAHLTPASVSTSMGGFALVDLVVVTNLVQSLRKLKDLGYWVVAADMDGKDIETVRKLHDKVVIVLGSEDKGVSRIVREAADHIVSISGSSVSIESLNVSVAAAILMERFGADYR